VPTCGSGPIAGCRTPAVGQKALLLLKDKVPDDKDQLGWKWIKGSATTLSDYGAPDLDDTYELCLYDGAGFLASATIPPGGICATKDCWQAKTTSFKYKDKELTPDGVLKLLLKEGLEDGKAKIILKGKGLNLDMPALGGALISPITVQLLSDGGVCWEAVYTAPFIKNDGAVFKDKAD
jgi:hypothetical protein